MKTIATAIIATVLGGTILSAQAFAATPDNGHLPPTYIVYKLVQDGVQLRKLETEHDVYEAWVDAGDGTLVKVGVDPHNAELTADFNDSRNNNHQSPAVDAAQAVQTVAATGHWDVREIGLKNGTWQVKAADDAGQMEKFRVDAQSGQIR